MVNDRRKSDKKEKYIDRTFKLVWSIGIAFLLYIVIPMESRLGVRIDKLESKLDSKQEQFMNYYLECKDDINKLKEEYKNDLIKIKDYIFALLKDNGRKS